MSDQQIASRQRSSAFRWAAPAAARKPVAALSSGIALTLLLIGALQPHAVASRAAAGVGSAEMPGQTEKPARAEIPGQVEMPGQAETPGQIEAPNILWLSSEDNGPQLGAYGDTFSDTPNLDALAQRGMIYSVAWSNAPVCGAARSTIITGMYPPSLGSQHHRSRVPLPEGIKFFPAYLRDAGYYTTNNAKTDYNLVPAGAGAGGADVGVSAASAATVEAANAPRDALMAAAWHESSNRAHWRDRPEGAPFFSVFNFGISHESRIRSRPHVAVHDPAAVRVPAYHPDAPEVRADWAQYYDKITEMDAQAGGRLAELEADGLADRTIVVYFGDHGPGLPRGKRSTMDSGLRVPLIVYVPERFRHLAPADWAPGRTNDRLVGFVDLAPTMLSLAGIEPPGHMQGRAFLGAHIGEPPEYLHGFRGRMDERGDLVRSVRDRRYVYVRNYLPHRPDGQHVAYMFQTPTTLVWKQLYDAGELPPEQAAYWEPRATEELYDLVADPDEVVNLAASPEHGRVLRRLRAAQRRHALEIRDLGFLPEAEVYRRTGLAATGQGMDEVEALAQPSTPYGLARDQARYNVTHVLQLAEQASDPQFYAAGDLIPALTHADSAIRYWAAVGLLIRGAVAVDLGREELWVLLGDEAPSVRIAAAEALGRYGSDADTAAALAVLLNSADLSRRPLYEVVAALNAIDYMDDRAAGSRELIAALPRERTDIPRALAIFVPALLDRILEELDELMAR